MQYRIRIPADATELTVETAGEMLELLDDLMTAFESYRTAQQHRQYQQYQASLRQLDLFKSCSNPRPDS